MRYDMDSMNPGKAMAQAAHASNAFIHEHPNAPGVDEWANETKQGFGTTIVLAVTEVEMKETIEDIHGERVAPCNIVHDPSYPVRDGAITHHLPIDTCAYVFASSDNEKVREVLDDFSLYP